MCLYVRVSLSIMNPLPSYIELRRKAAQEAIRRLGLLRVGAAYTVYNLLEDAQALHPKAICTAYRKQGEQLTDEEKEGLGIRKNAFMAREALTELTELGLQDPIRAHELTVLRASFTMFRYRNAVSARGMMREYPDTPIEIRYDVFHADTCDLCKSLDGKLVDVNWGLFPPEGCTCVTAPYGLRVHMDYISGCIAQERNAKHTFTHSLIEKLKELIQRNRGN